VYSKYSRDHEGTFSVYLIGDPAGSMFLLEELTRPMRKSRVRNASKRCEELALGGWNGLITAGMQVYIPASRPFARDSARTTMFILLGLRAILLSFNPIKLGIYT
jgi:hypothetical protein